MASLVQEFKLYQMGGLHNVELKKIRVQELREFFLHSATKSTSLGLRVAFLQSRGYTREEMEDALELASLTQDYARLLQGDFSSSANTAASHEAATHSDHHNTSSSPADAHQTISGMISCADGFWRIGQTVFAYLRDLSYYPVPLLGFDLSRAEDVICIAHQLPSGEYGHKQYLPPGFKGVVPDEYPTCETVTVGTTVIAQEKPDAYRGHFKEAVVTSVSPVLDSDGNFTVGLEWAHNSKREENVDFRSIRLLYHPKIIRRDLEYQEAERKKNRGASDRIDSAGSFLARDELAVIRKGREEDNATSQMERSQEAETTGAPEKLNGALKNFQHYGDLDVFEQPRDLRTGQAFVRSFGAAPREGVARTFPIFPTSQEHSTGIAYGLNLSSITKHPRSHVFCTFNPIVTVARQCAALDQMFVDPDFPPSYYSISGSRALARSNDPTKDNPIGSAFSAAEERNSIVWRRLSEIMFRPRLQILGSRATRLRPGRYSPPWLESALLSLSASGEFEDIISPMEDGWIFGAYVVRLFLEGRWHFVVVDDFVPCDSSTGEPLTMLSGTSNELYPTLIEKALAKVEGNYEALLNSNRRSSVTLGRFWEDLTGNGSEIYDHDCITDKRDVNENIFASVVSEGAVRSLHARVRAFDDLRYVGLGFEVGQYWHIDDAHREIEQLPPSPFRAGSTASSAPTIQFYFHVYRGENVADPIANIDVLRDQFTEHIPAGVLAQLPTVESDATPFSYWIEASDFYRIFSHTESLYVLYNSHKASFEGSFLGRYNAGGKMDGIDRLLHNPQILFSFVQPTEILVQLSLSDRRLRGGAEASLPVDIDGIALQLHVLKGRPVEKPLACGEDYEIEFIAASQFLRVCDDNEAQSIPRVSVRLSLPIGNYIVIPTVGCASRENFTITAFSIANFYMKLLN